MGPLKRFRQLNTRSAAVPENLWKTVEVLNRYYEMGWLFMQVILVATLISAFMVFGKNTYWESLVFLASGFPLFFWFKGWRSKGISKRIDIILASLPKRHHLVIDFQRGHVSSANILDEDTEIFERIRKSQDGTMHLWDEKYR